MELGFIAYWSWDIQLVLAQYKEGTLIHEEICGVNFNQEEWKRWKASNKTASWLNRFMKRIGYHLVTALGIVFKQQKGMNSIWFHSEMTKTG